MKKLTDFCRRPFTVGSMISRASTRYGYHHVSSDIRLLSDTDTLARHINKHPTHIRLHVPVQRTAGSRVQDHGVL
jgi:hypothetical protein